MERVRWQKERGSDYYRRYRLQSLYGLTLEDYVLICESQNGVCAICEESEIRKLQGKVVPLSVDHDHETGKVRGLLCQRCNTSLGYLEGHLQRKEWKNRALEYIKEHKE